MPTRTGEELDRPTWSRKIISHTGDPMTGKARGKEEVEEEYIDTVLCTTLNKG